MIVVVMDPHPDRLLASLLGLIDAGIEAFLGKQPLVAFNLPVMPRRVHTRALIEARHATAQTSRIVRPGSSPRCPSRHE